MRRSYLSIPIKGHGAIDEYTQELWEPMIQGKKISVVLPAYNAEKTLQKTWMALERSLVDDIILVDDCSQDRTVEIALRLGLHVIRHEQNMGYGGNQKTCYRTALERGGDIVIMVHPDYQYAPELVPAMGWLIACGLFDVVLGSRILGTGALEGGMPRYKYMANRLLTAFQNYLMSHKLSEYHTGYRAFSREVLETLPLEENGNDFIFDNQMLAQIIHFGFRIGEMTCPTRYTAESSSINLRRSLIYGLGVMKTSLQFRLHKLGLYSFPIFSPEGRKLVRDHPKA